MDFIKDLNSLREAKLAEIKDEKRKVILEKFTEYITKLFIDNKNEIQTAFKNCVINHPHYDTHTVEKEFYISNDDALGIEIFFEQEGGKYVDEFIKNITETEYKGFKITIKNTTEYPKSYPNIPGMPVPGVARHSPAYKIFVRFAIDFRDFKNDGVCV
jgi:hypothetical protein